jgi:hypothetical protein
MARLSLLWSCIIRLIGPHVPYVGPHVPYIGLLVPYIGPLVQYEAPRLVQYEAPRLVQFTSRARLKVTGCMFGGAKTFIRDAIILGNTDV